MGTETRHLNIRYVSSESELLFQWAQRQSDDQYERGHDPYSGALMQAYLSIRKKTFPTYKGAVEFAQSENVEKGYAVAYKYGDNVGFPRTKSDFELVEKIKVMQKEMDCFHSDIRTRFMGSKSSSKKCVHCESTISKKSRKNVLATAARLADSSGKRANVQATDCPACGGNLLVTDTDKKRWTSLHERHNEAVKKHDALMQTAKKTATAWGYYIVAAVPS